MDDWLIPQQELDQFCQEMTERQGKGIIEKDEFKYLPSRILFTSGGKIVVQATLRRQIMELYHDQKLAGDLGIVKMTANVSNEFF